MRALSLWQPWDRVVVRGLKPVENRTWAPPVSIWGQPLAVHRAQRFDKDGYAFCLDTVRDLGLWQQRAVLPGRPEYGAVVGVV